MYGRSDRKGRGNDGGESVHLRFLVDVFLRNNRKECILMRGRCSIASGVICLSLIL